VSRADGNPRLKWRSLTLSLGAALLDENYDAAERLRGEARALSDAAFSPGPLAVETFFLGQELISRDDPEALTMLRVPDTEPGLANPVARAAVAYVHARTGDHGTAVQYARRALRQVDHESSYLLVCTRSAAAAVAAGDHDLARDLIGLLNPWTDHISVDGNGWWCDGPVALWLAQLHHLLGHEAQTHTHLAKGEAQARALNDLRSLRRASVLRAELPASISQSPSIDLTVREMAVLELLASGATNPSIARTLAYSLSTIRNDTISIYRKMGVTGRPEAVAKAINMGLVAPTT
jgi:ATP/maltotriose-dependent transcriptional regulator MalT